MDKLEYVKKVKQSLEEIMNVTPYDLITFGSSEDEQAYIEKKTDELDVLLRFVQAHDKRFSENKAHHILNQYHFQNGEMSSFGSH